MGAIVSIKTSKLLINRFKNLELNNFKNVWLGSVSLDIIGILINLDYFLWCLIPFRSLKYGFVFLQGELVGNYVVDSLCRDWLCFYFSLFPGLYWTWRCINLKFHLNLFGSPY